MRSAVFSLCLAALTACAGGNSGMSDDDSMDPPGPVDPGSGTGSGGGSMDCDDPATCVNECGPTIDPSAFTSCSADGHCVPTSLIPADQQAQFSTCPDGASLCVPDVFIESGGNFILPTCKSIGDAEGRCVSMTLPAVAAQSANLPQDICQTTERCVPCWDPISGEETGVCSISCDTGPAGPPPAPAPKCCGGIGTCLDAAVVPEDQASHLAEDTCPAGEGYLCIPDEFISGAPPTTCTAMIFGLIPVGDGICAPTCLPDVAANADLLSDEGCPADHKCVPCNDPFSGEPSGACPPAM